MSNKIHVTLEVNPESKEQKEVLLDVINYLIEHGRDLMDTAICYSRYEATEKLRQLNPEDPDYERFSREFDFMHMQFRKHEIMSNLSLELADVFITETEFVFGDIGGHI